MSITELMGNVKVVAFDIDGTLADVDNILNLSDDCVYNLVKSSFPRIRLTSPNQVTNMIMERAMDPQNTLPVGAQRMKLYEELACDAGYPKEVGSTLYQAWQERRNQYAFYPHAVELLQYLHNNGYTTIVITDGTADFSYHPEICSSVDLFINPQSHSCTKTDGTSYEYVLQNMNAIHPHEFLMVGDNPISDIANAAKYGWRTMLIAPYDYHGVHPDYRVACVGDFLSLLKKEYDCL